MEDNTKLSDLIQYFVNNSTTYDEFEYYFNILFHSSWTSTEFQNFCKSYYKIKTKKSLLPKQKNMKTMIKNNYNTIKIKIQQHFGNRIIEKTNITTIDKTLQPINENINNHIFLEESRVGLHNFGNSCYMNSVLQVLFNISEFNSFITSINNDNCKVISSLAYLNSIYTTKKESYVKPLDIYNLLPRIFNRKTSELERNDPRKNQEDAQEFLVFLFDIIIEEFLNSNHDSFEKQQILKMRSNGEKVISFDYIFGTILQTNSRCDKCKKKNSCDKKELFLSLSLDIINATSLKECFDEFFSFQEVEKECLYCKIKLSESKQNYEIVSLPTILCLHLKRFCTDGSKIKKFIKFDKEIIVNNMFYVLDSVVVHRGATLNAGHYVTIKKNTSTGHFFLYDDKNVSKVDEEFVLKSEAYILLYTQKVSKHANTENKVTIESEILSNDTCKEFPGESLEEYSTSDSSEIEGEIISKENQCSDLEELMDISSEKSFIAESVDEEYESLQNYNQNNNSGEPMDESIDNFVPNYNRSNDSGEAVDESMDYFVPNINQSNDSGELLDESMGKFKESPNLENKSDPLHRYKGLSRLTGT